MNERHISKGARGRLFDSARWLGRRLLVASIHAYQGVSSLTPGACRFEPSCSHYGLEAVRVHGPLVGGWLTLRRILRCRPGGGWGYDPVPEVEMGPAAESSNRQPERRPFRTAGATRGGSLRNG